MSVVWGFCAEQHHIIDGHTLFLGFGLIESGGIIAVILSSYTGEDFRLLQKIAHGMLAVLKKLVLEAELSALLLGG